MKRELGVVVGAILLDEILGDPPNVWHPVAWMGTLIGACGNRCRRMAGYGRFSVAALFHWAALG